MKRLYGVLPLLLVCILLSGCPSNSPVTTPAAPNPTSLTVINLDKTVLDQLVTVNNTVKTLRDQGKMAEAQVVTVQNYLLLAGQCLKATDTVALQAQGADLTSAQKSAIVTIWASSGLSAAKAQLSPNAVLIVSTIVTGVNQVLAIIGGPQL